MDLYPKEFQGSNPDQLLKSVAAAGHRRSGRAWIERSDIVYNIRNFYPCPQPTRDALRLGIHPRTLYALRDAGEIEQVGRGLYRLSTAPALSSPDLVPIAIRIPRAVVCLISALAHHGLTTQIPHAIDIALPSHANVPKVDGVPLRVFWYPKPSFRGR